MSKAVKIFWIIFMTLLVFFGILLLYATLTDYKPKEKILIYQSKKNQILTDSIYNFMIWNIGYCGMSKEIDFFYDGGTQTRVSKKITEHNVKNITQFIENQKDSIDFILLQEVDTNAKRSYHINEYQIIRDKLSGYHCFFGTNYNVPFIPVPITKPYGKVVAGLVNCSRYEPSEVIRYQYPGNFAWPKNLFMLDRCFLLMRYKLSNGKDLVVINTHNSAFDNGSLRKQQMKYLKNKLIEEYQKGNYIVVGGDWNQVPPNYKYQYTDFVSDSIYVAVPKNLFPQWQWVYDPTKPTNRNSDQVYDKSKTPTKIIDFYLLSPNIQVIDIHTIDMDFENSDHNPVFLTIKLKQ